MIKKLFILGLLLIPSFSFAVNNFNDIGDYEYIAGNYCTINSNLSFDCSETDNVIVGADANSSISYFWTNQGLGFYYNDIRYNDRLQEGYVSDFLICNGSFNCAPDYNYLSYTGFVEYVNNHNLIGWGWYSPNSSNSYAGPSFVFEGDVYISIVAIDHYHLYGNYDPYDFGLTGVGYDIDYSSVGVINTPFYGVPVDGSYDIGDVPYTYGQIVEGYEACGLDVGYCYGGFPIDDIFEPNQSIEDFTGYKFGYGANIRYLYSLYSSSYTPKEFFHQMLLAYYNGQINRFKNEPKALIMFVQQYVSGKERGLLNVGFYDLWDYCNIKLGYTDLNLEYTGHNQTPKTCYKFKVSNDSNQGGFSFSGDNAYNSIVGSGKEFKNASQFFGKLSSIFNNGIGSINTNYSGFIPTYILVFMFAFIFIRLISK